MLGTVRGPRPGLRLLPRLARLPAHQRRTAHPAALTDLRASYGGTSFGIGLLLGYAALRPRYLVLGLLAALAVIASGGAARLYGVLIDASPALTTFLWLGAEALLCVLLLAALWKTRQLDLD
ncbi:DUF4345 family protein [Pseudomonas aeruginosa]